MMRCPRSKGSRFAIGAAVGGGIAALATVGILAARKAKMDRESGLVNRESLLAAATTGAAAALAAGGVALMCR